MKKIALSLIAVLLVVFALIAINMQSSNESSNMLNARTRKAAHVESGKHLFPLWRMNGNRWKGGSGVRRTSKRICYSKRFHNVPKVSVSFYETDVVKNANLRVNLWVSHVGRKCFTVVFQTWSNTHIWSIGASWVAHGQI